MTSSGTAGVQISETLFFNNVGPMTFQLPSFAVLRSTSLSFVQIVRIPGVGYYTADCSKPCPAHCTEGYCRQEDGYCQCPAGMFGPTCNLPCPDDAWGPNCVHECRCHGANSLGCDPQVRTPDVTHCTLLTLHARFVCGAVARRGW